LPLGRVICGECGEEHEEAFCPCCGEQPEAAMVGVLQTEVVTEAGTHLLVTAQRDDETGGWAPVLRQYLPPTWGASTEEDAR
jgi:hypothetical protein